MVLAISSASGGVIPMDYSRSVTITNPGFGLSGPGTNTSTYNPGEVINAAIGYRLPMRFRVEGELGFQHFTANTISPNNTNGIFPAFTGARLSNPSGGEHDMFTSTANLFSRELAHQLGIAAIATRQRQRAKQARTALVED
jgi:hypothetical protein